MGKQNVRELSKPPFRACPNLSRGMGVKKINSKKSLCAFDKSEFPLRYNMRKS